MPKPGFYAVVDEKHNVITIVESWDECEKLTNRVKGGVKFKKFK